jgi:CubicO group peptidase (beta-lactamase class C family)
MRSWGMIACLILAIAAPHPGIAADGAAADLVGIWASQMRYGPDVHGPLLVMREGGNLVAEIAGLKADAKLGAGQIDIDFGADFGEFRAPFSPDQSLILGHWIQPRTNGLGQRYATPVTLERDAAGRWQGNVEPLPDTMSMILVVANGEDGSTRAFIRNPERNIGKFLGNDRLERQGDNLRLVADGKKDPIATGFYDDNNGLISLYFRQFGTTLDFQRSGPATERAYYTRGKSPTPYAYAPPPALDDGWPIGSLKDAGLDEVQVAALVADIANAPMDSLNAPQIHSVLIARHGKLVAEEYFHGSDRDTLHDTRSAAKSVTSLLTGAAIDHGARFTPSTKVIEAVDPALLPPKIDPRLGAMRVENLLTMSSGFDCDDNNDASPGNEDNMQGQRKEPNWWRYTLALPMARDPGTKAVYCSINPNLTGAVLSHETGQWLPDLFRELLAGPLGIKRYAMNLTPTGDAYMGGGVRFGPRDFLKFGQLVLTGGTWNGKRVVSRDWVARSTSHLVDLQDRGYGYFWWVVDVPYAGRTVHTVQALGNGGQIIVAIPEFDLVVGFFGGNYSDGKAASYWSKVLLPKYILPAVQN